MHNPFYIRTGYFLFSMFFPSKAYGKENFPKEKAIIVANHYTAFDPAFLYKFTKRDLFFLCKKEALKKKTVRALLTEAGAISVDREASDMRALMNAMKVLKDGKKLVIFPEGTRNKTGDELQELKGGAGLLAVRTKTPVVPVMFYKRAKVFRRTHFIVGKPFELTEFYDKKLQKEDYDEIDGIIREKMLETRAELIRLSGEKRKKCK
ncbi:MAG: hypothetical protein DBX59_09810 [Bacillota bacterium]|nr:MAG: hypothetical protein DBX59_09810 [Bacillota bacterium]